ncbi:MAG: hypothetical protein PWP03_81 [Candidatus Woesearchaeota archaeon]|nr:hypothetical protein [Candidatus Woesearchaeota archaeon]MDN5327443.1 hypothetical protein [Candidatus Woesearchaeota archaeon]
MNFENKKVFWFVISVVLLIFIIVVNGRLKTSTTITSNIVSNNTSGSALERFAQCLTDKGVKLYGAYWCPHCREQKEAFKEGLVNLTYIECSNPDGSQTQACREAGIRAYPTWIFQDGKRIEGELSLQKISQLSGCKLEQ